MAFEVREATPDDVEGIAAVVRETWVVTYPNEDLEISRSMIAAKDFDDPGILEAHRDRLATADPARREWVACDDELVAGWCSASRGGERHRLGALYVLPRLQGLGLGRRLLNEALAWLGERQPVSLEVASYNEPAIRFYERNGFRRSGRPAQSSAALLPDGTRIPEIEMVRPPAAVEARRDPQ